VKVNALPRSVVAETLQFEVDASIVENGHCDNP
jgi:hypothetical protein